MVSVFALLACGAANDRNNASGASGSEGADESATAADSAEGTGSATAASASGVDDNGGDLTGIPVKLDLGEVPDAPPTGCDGADGGGGGGGGGGNADLSYIWISNSSQGTISKIDTQSIVEEGRYIARDGSPLGNMANGYSDPSRTSVNLNGDVAVASRNGGLTKFWANTNDCIDSNGDAGIQTSTGANDILAWGMDDCRAWHLPLTCSSNRPVAWTRGIWNENACGYEDAKVWTVCDEQTLLVDGETGVIEETVPVPGGQYPFVYGGAADADGNFWGLDTGSSQIYRVDFDDLSVYTHALGPNGGYGITVDPMGRPWTCGGGGVARFDLDSESWQSAGSQGIGGCMTDGESLIWHSNPQGTLHGYDLETLALVETIALPEYVHGISVDFYGYVWGVSFAGNNAYRADPETDAVDQYGGLDGAYTYSDMTGFALSSAGGGGDPPG
jgi:hypothetical protein